MLLLGSCVGLLPKIFSLRPFGRAIALAVGAFASTPNPLGFGIAWRRRGDGYDPKALAERPQGNSFGGGARGAAPFPGPAAPGMAGHVPLSKSSRSETEGPLFQTMRPADIGGRTRGIVETVSLRSTHPIISQFGINPFFTDVHVQKFPEGPSFSHVLESPMGFVFRDGFCRARSRLFSETGSGEEPWRSLASNWRPAVGSSD